MPLDLSNRQEATIGAALTVLSSLVILSAVAAIVWLLSIFLRSFSHILLPLAVAAVTALVLKPFHEWFVGRLRLPPVVAVVAVFLSLLLPVTVLGFFFGGIIVDQVSDLVARTPRWWAALLEQIEIRSPQIKEFWQRWQLSERLPAAIEESQGALLSGLQFVGGKALSAGAGIFSGIGGLLNWLLFPIYVAFLLLADVQPASSTWADAVLPFLKSDTRRDISYLVREFVNILVAFFRGQLLIALLQGMLFAIGFSAVGLRYGLILGLLLGFLNIIPYLGSIVGLAVALPLAMFQGGGGIWMVLWVMVVFTAVQMIEGYVLTPKIMGDRTGLHPMVIMVAVFFWASALNGILGMIMAIPLTAFFVVFWRLVREKYIRELV